VGGEEYRSVGHGGVILCGKLDETGCSISSWPDGIMEVPHDLLVSHAWLSCISTSL
jgi:hypothetical protein